MHVLIDQKDDGQSCMADIEQNDQDDTGDTQLIEAKFKQMAPLVAKSETRVTSVTATNGQSNGLASIQQIPDKLTAIPLINYENNRVYKDTLHSKSKKKMCPYSYCAGSLMRNLVADKDRPQSDTLEQAADFANQYYASLGQPEEAENRISDFRKQLFETGTIDLTYDELVFGAKTAWRNAARCIGRIQWQKLQLFDARDCTNTQQMFEALKKHISYATNGGNIRSTITIFPPRMPGRADFRVWNSQLVSFAAYQQSDGSIIGDPANVDITKIAQRLGWKGKGTRFDILPLVLSAPEDGAHYYEIPEELIMLVQLRHPQYEKTFEQLDLKWYAVPAVSDMQLDCAGLQFTGAPFNGWYMQTEISVRDFLDKQRYDLSEPIAHALGLDTSSEVSLWKDRVALEMSVAVLHSYRNAGVTLVDHHTASRQFIQHYETEQQIRGGCPADWVWLTPPLTGGATRVFHLEMINYLLKPSYEYQDKAWKSYDWKVKAVKLKYKFSNIARSVRWTTSIMAAIKSKRINATVLYATETGKSKEFAEKFAQLIQNHLTVAVKCMDEYQMDQLPKQQLLILVASTFGNGESPDNGRDFWRELYAWQECADRKQMLNAVMYMVFALGSSQYATFCQFGQKLDAALAALGGHRLQPLACGDELRGQEQAFNGWCARALTTLAEAQVIPNGSQLANIQAALCSQMTPAYNVKNFRLVSPPEHLKPLTREQLRYKHWLANSRYKLFHLDLAERRRLYPKNSDRQTLLLNLKSAELAPKLCEDEPSEPAMQYIPGDHLAIYPQNPVELVDQLLGHLQRMRTTEGLDANAQITLEVLDQATGQWTKDRRLPYPLSLRDALSGLLDISSPPHSNFLSLCADAADDRWDSHRLRRLAQSTKEYERWRRFHCPNLADLFQEFPSIKIEPQLLLSQLPLIQPRYYSISSSLEYAKDQMHLTVSLATYKTHDEKGPQRYGLCSSYLEQYADKNLLCYIRSAPNFRLPADASTPVIMIGAGSGIAPFRGFWQQRCKEISTEKVAQAGKMILFFGCRQSKIDNIYGHELPELLKEGVLHDVYYAYSRDAQHKKRYVQDQVLKQRAMIAWLLGKCSAHIYVCGDAMMANGVRRSLRKLIESEFGLSEAAAEQRVQQYINENRYHEDVFGAIHH